MKAVFSSDFLSKAFKFGIVGFSGILVDYSFTIFGKEFLFLDKYLANSLGFFIAASSNFLLNRKWTFKSENPKIGREYLMFVFIATIGLTLNNLIIWLMSDAWFSFNFYLAKLLAIFIVFGWNFFMNNTFNFNSRNVLGNKLETNNQLLIK
jgi:putative flippase GtrA